MQMFQPTSLNCHVKNYSLFVFCRLFCRLSCNCGFLNNAWSMALIIEFKFTYHKEGCVGVNKFLLMHMYPLTRKKLKRQSLGCWFQFSVCLCCIFISSKLHSTTTMTFLWEYDNCLLMLIVFTFFTLNTHSLREWNILVCFTLKWN